MILFALFSFILILPAFAEQNDGLAAFYPFEGSGRVFEDARYR